MNPNFSYYSKVHAYCISNPIDVTPIRWTIFRLERDPDDHHVRHDRRDLLLHDLSPTEKASERTRIADQPNGKGRQSDHIERHPWNNRSD